MKTVEDTWFLWAAHSHDLLGFRAHIKLPPEFSQVPDRMILYTADNLFRSPAQTLVNTVNTVGVMGRGVALQFKRIFPEMFREYQDMCERRELRIGVLHIYRGLRKNVLNFPTKTTWRRPSKPEYIEAGLKTFVQIYQRAGIVSAAFPPLGCGNGALDFKSQVQPLMEHYLDPLPIPIFIHLYRGRRSTPEHVVPDETKQWLQKQPASLSFWEVWDHLEMLLSQRTEFATVGKGNPFRVAIVREHDNATGLRFTTSAKSWVIRVDTLVDVWHRLVDGGYVSAEDVPPYIKRNFPYILPVLTSLEYISTVRVSEDSVMFERQPRIAMRLDPPAMSEVPDLFSALG